jgi:hypothetical protein
MAGREDFEYVIGQSAVNPLAFTVTKFIGDAPRVTYNVVCNIATGYGKCDCPAAAYRNTGSADKHVLMVRKWLQAGNGNKGNVK